jgi:hypothetical protein
MRASKERPSGPPFVWPNWVAHLARAPFSVGCWDYFTEDQDEEDLEPPEEMVRIEPFDCSDRYRFYDENIRLGPSAR